jgi:hypothetical protein
VPTRQLPDRDRPIARQEGPAFIGFALASIFLDSNNHLDRRNSSQAALRKSIDAFLLLAIPPATFTRRIGRPKPASERRKAVRKNEWSDPVDPRKKASFKPAADSGHGFHPIVQSEERSRETMDASPAAKLVPSMAELGTTHRDLRFHPTATEYPETLSSEQIAAFNRNGYLRRRCYRRRVAPGRNTTNLANVGILKMPTEQILALRCSAIAVAPHCAISSPMASEKI